MSRNLQNLSRLIASLWLFIAPSCLGGQSTASLSIDKQVVRAGDSFTVTIDLDRAASYTANLGVYFGPASGQPNGIGNAVSLEKGSTHGTITLNPAIDFAGGDYLLDRVYFGLSTTRELGFKPVTVTVIPTDGLVAPTSAKVKLTPSQNQFLLTKTVELTSIINGLTTRMSRDSADTPALKREVRSSLVKAAGLLPQARTDYLKLFGTADPDPIFFSDLANHYRAAIIDITPVTQSGGSTSQGRSPVSYQLRERSSDAAPPISYTGSQPLYATGAIALLNANAEFYTIILDTGRDEFLVDLRSEPPDAAIEYRRVTQQFAPFSKRTDQTNVPLKLAFWYFRFTHGACTQTLEANPVNERHPKLGAELKCGKK